MADFPTIKSTHSLVAKHVTKERWDKLSGIVSKTSGFTLAKAIACAVEFDNQVINFNRTRPVCVFLQQILKKAHP